MTTKTFYQIEWLGSGETDVFADQQDAIENYKNDEQWMQDWVIDGGFETETPDENATWSKAAKARKINETS